MAPARRPIGAISQYNPGEYRDSTGGFFTGSSLDNAVYHTDDVNQFETIMGRGQKAATPPPPSDANPMSGVGFIARPSTYTAPTTPPPPAPLYVAPPAGTPTVPPTARVTTPSALLTATTQGTPARNPLTPPLTPPGNTTGGAFAPVAGFELGKLSDPNQPFNDQGKYTPAVRSLSQGIGATNAAPTAAGLQQVVDWINANGGRATVSGRDGIDFLDDQQDPLDVIFDEGSENARWQMLQPWLPGGGDGGGGDQNTILAASAPAGATTTPDGGWITEQLAPPSGNNGGMWIDNKGELWTLSNGTPTKMGAGGTGGGGTVGPGTTVTPGGISCFPAGTMIATPKGARAIEKLNPGDHVLATADREHGEVTIAVEHCARPLIALQFEGGVGGELLVTAEHPIWSVDKKRFDFAGELIVGERVLRLGVGPVRITAIGVAPDAPVYNLTVAPQHTFFANGILVHNKSIAGPGTQGNPGPTTGPGGITTPNPNPTSLTVPHMGEPGFDLDPDLQQVGQDEFSQLLQSVLGGLISGGGSTPYGNDVAQALADMIGSGGGFNTERFEERFGNLRDAEVRAQQGMQADARDQLASRGLLGSGDEAASTRRISEQLAPDFANAVSEAYLDESGAADDRVMQALQLATGLSQSQAQNLLSAVQGGTQRQGVLADIAIRVLSENADWAEFLAKYNLTVDQVNEEIQSGRMTALIPILQAFLNLGGLTSGGYI